MGTCKARLAVDGVPLVQRIAHSLEASVGQVILVAKRSQFFEDLGLPVLLDASDERALVHGFATVLTAPGPPWRFICATDMPEVGPLLLWRLWERALQSGRSGSYPVRPEGDAPEPLPSLWHLPLSEGSMESWGMSARDWVRSAGLAPCPLRLGEEGMLVHVNEPQQWREYLEEQSRRSAP